MNALSYALLVVFVDALGVGIAIPIMPDLVKDLGQHTPANLAWYVGVVASSYPLMQFVCAPLIGRLSDHFGRRPILIAAMLMLGVDYLIQAVAPHVYVLLVGRVLAGIAGSSVAAANALVADISNDQNRVKNFGMIGAVYGLGLIVGPALGSGLGALYLRAPLWLIVGLAWSVGLAGMFRMAKQDLNELTPACKLRQRQGMQFGEQQVGLVAGYVQLMRRHPLLVYVTGAILFTSLAQRGLESLFVLYSSLRFDWSRWQAGTMLTLLGVMAVLVQGLLAKPIIGKFGERPIAIGGAIILMCSLAAISLADRGWMLYPILAVGALSGLSGPALQSMVTKRLDQTEQGQAQGVVVAVVNLAGTIAPFVFSSLVLHTVVSDSNASQWLGLPFLLGSLLVATGVAILAVGLSKECVGTKARIDV